MEKKGEMQLLWKVVGYVLSALVILLLIYFGVKMALINSGENDLQKSEKVLITLDDRINIIKNSGVSEDRVIIFPVKNWFLRSFFGADTPQGECLKNKYCLCVCDDVTCNGNRKCNGFDFEVGIIGSATTVIPGGGYMQPAGIDITENNSIKFENTVQNIKLNNNGKITLTKA